MHATRTHTYRHTHTPCSESCFLDIMKLSSGESLNVFSSPRDQSCLFTWNGPHCRPLEPGSGDWRHICRCRLSLEQQAGLSQRDCSPCSWEASEVTAVRLAGGSPPRWPQLVPEASFLGVWKAVSSLCPHVVTPLCMSGSSSLLVRTPGLWGQDPP